PEAPSIEPSWKLFRTHDYAAHFGIIDDGSELDVEHTIGHGDRKGDIISLLRTDFGHEVELIDDHFILNTHIEDPLAAAGMVNFRHLQGDRVIAFGHRDGIRKVA